MRSLYIFGNGLGMAISPEAFNLTNALIDVWDDGTLEDEQKALISACLPADVQKPTSEEQLAKLQNTVDACEILLSIRDTGAAHWLSEEGGKFPEAVYKLTYAVARKMYLAKHMAGEDLGATCRAPEEFIAPLIQKIRDTGSHVATLNYDGLLSNALLEADILGGDNPVLFDGFVESIFDRKNLFRKKGYGGWYLHLHGSPLFSGKAGSKWRKISEAAISRKRFPIHAGRHLVLTHFTNKPRIIAASDILSIYWEFLQMALDESERIVIFGYSGNDTHLNRLISQARGTKDTIVVDWLGSGSRAVRQPFWDDQLGGDVHLELLEDVFTFIDW
ncbi:hypothetical protein GH722_04025 [Alphaproteobacteria bacterium HT1-32]|nr:hypothetical protein [Alphaproteobacteria bacterium HT1-32]